MRRHLSPGVAEDAIMELAHTMWTVVAPHSGLLEDLESLLLLSRALFPLRTVALRRACQIAGGPELLVVSALALGDLDSTAWVMLASTHEGWAAPVKRRHVPELLCGCCSRGLLELCRVLHRGVGITAEEARVGGGRALALACLNGHLAVARWLVETFDMTTQDAAVAHTDALTTGRVGESWARSDRIRGGALQMACTNGHAGVVEWLVGRFGKPEDPSLRSECLTVCCTGGHLECATRLKQVIPESGVVNAFRGALKEGRVTVVSWLLSSFSAELEARPSGAKFVALLKDSHPVCWPLLTLWYGPLKGLCGAEDSKDLLARACSVGDLAVVKWLVTDIGIAVQFGLSSKYDECVASGIVEGGNKEIAEWLHPPQHWWECKSHFWMACRHGRLELAQWLASRWNQTSEASNALREAIEGGHLEVCRWLKATFHLERSDVVLEDVGPYSFDRACEKGLLLVAQWVADEFDLNREDLMLSNFDGLMGVCRYGQLEAAKWLTCRFSLIDEDARAEDDCDRGTRVVVFAVSSGNLPLLQWFVRTFHFSHEELREDSYISEALKECPSLDLVEWFAKETGVVVASSEPSK